MVLRMKLELANARFVAVTTDMWTSIANIDFMAVSGHFHSEDENGVIQLKNRWLEVVPFPDINHSAENMKSFLLKVCGE